MCKLEQMMGLVVGFDSGLSEADLVSSPLLDGFEDQTRALKVAARLSAGRTDLNARMEAVGMFRDLIPRVGAPELADYFDVSKSTIRRYLAAWQRGEAQSVGGDEWALLSPSMRLLRLPFYRAAEAFV